MTTSNSCVTVCPSNLFLNATSQSCVGCTTPCSTCSNYPNNCSSCATGYYLLSTSTVNSTCLINCPTSYFILGNDCIACPT